VLPSATLNASLTEGSFRSLWSLLERRDLLQRSYTNFRAGTKIRSSTAFVLHRRSASSLILKKSRPPTSHLHRGIHIVDWMHISGRLFRLNTLTSKFKETYVPAGVQLGWLVDPINKTIFTFKKESDGVVRRRPHQWYDSNNNAGVLSGGEVLPGFTLSLEEIDATRSQAKPPLKILIVIGSRALNATRFSF